MRWEGTGLRPAPWSVVMLIVFIGIEDLVRYGFIAEEPCVVVRSSQATPAARFRPHLSLAQ